MTDFTKKINQVFTDLDSMLTHSQQEDKTVQEHFRFVYQTIKNGDLAVRFNSNLTYDFFGCSSFIVSKVENKVEMEFGQFVLDKYVHYPNLVYAIVMHTFQYAYDYYTNHSTFMVGTENQIESIFFKLDAITFEAMFLKAYCSNNQKNGPFEQFLIIDFDSGLRSASTLFLKTDIQLLHTMNALKSKKGTSKSLLVEFKQIGEDLIKAFHLNNKSEWEKYCALILLKTYVYHSKQIIFDIVHVKDGISLDSFVFEQYTDNRSTIDQLIKLIELNKDIYSFQDKVLKAYGDKYTN